MDLELLGLTVRAGQGRGFKVLDIELDCDKRNGVVQLAIGGSDSRRDWKRNRDQILTPWPNRNPGFVHWGFLEASCLINPLCARLTRYADQVEVAGHSFGGAVAVLLALALYEAGRPVSKVVTFGAPRVGDRAFCESYPIPVTRYVCGFDPVPHLPPWWRYADLSPPIQLPSQMTWHDKLLPWQWLRKDHCLFSYQRALEERK